MDYEAKVELMEQRVAAMESDIKEIKNDVKSMPEQIANKIDESVDMKIKLAISETEKKYMEKLEKQAEQMLCEEFSIALSIPLDEIPTYIQKRVEITA